MKQSSWNKMVHTSFKKVVASDLLYMVIGTPIGAGLHCISNGECLQDLFIGVVNYAQ